MKKSDNKITVLEKFMFSWKYIDRYITIFKVTITTYSNGSSKFSHHFYISLFQEFILFDLPQVFFKIKIYLFLIKEHWSEGNPKWYCGVGTDLETLLTNLGGKKRSGYFDMGPSIYYVSKGLVNKSKNCWFNILSWWGGWVRKSPKIC